VRIKCKKCGQEKEACKDNLKAQGLSKCGESIAQYLGYTMGELKAHLEARFEPWMNWNNYGMYRETEWCDGDPSTWKWQIDHVKPHSEFPYDSMKHPNFKRCWSLENLRPYSAKKNCLDGVHRTRHK